LPQRAICLQNRRRIPESCSLHLIERHMNPSSAALRSVLQKIIDVQPTVSASVLVGLGITTLVMSPAEAATATYTDRISFESSLDALVIDDYSNPGYAFIQSDLAMSSVLGETSYSATGFPESNVVFNPPGTTDFIYCAGCNGSFVLSFTTTSVGTTDGIFGVGFEFSNGVFGVPSVPLYDAFVTFGDGSKQNIPLPFAIFLPPLNTFFGISSSLSVKSIAIGLPNAQATNQGAFSLDNLTIGRPVPGPLPLLGVGTAFGFSRKLRKRIKSTTPVAGRATVTVLI